MDISRRFAALLLSLLTLTLPTTAADAGISQCHPSTFTFPPLLGAAHIRTTVAVVRNYTGHPGWMPDAAVSVPPSGVAPFCNVTVSYVHPGYDFVVSVHVWLPLERKAWNGRLLGVGGGGFVAGDVDGDFMAAGVMGGYAVAATDGGHWKGVPVREWALKGRGNLDWDRFVEFAYRGVGEMGDVGGGIVREFYGQKEGWRYFAGCSTGGRQGLVLAARDEGEWDGVLSMCPAVDFPAVVGGMMGPQVVMREMGWWPGECEVREVVRGVVEGCDAADGVVDGIIGRLGECEVGFEALEGRGFKCGDEKGRVDGRTVEVLRRVMRGLEDEEGRVVEGGYGYVPGAPLVGLLGLMNVKYGGDGGCQGEPFEVAEDWVKYFVKKDAEFDVGNMTMDEFRDVFRQGVEEFTSAIGTSHDLRRFRERGGKMLMWHGMADQTVMVLAARAFYERARKLEQSRGVEIEDYWRYFEVPGMNHCSPLYGGPYPWDAMERLRKWVEEGVPPQDLEARTIEEEDGRNVFGKVARRVCMFPKEGVWDGSEWQCLQPGEKLDEKREEL
ncbi:feruloyl esterase b precursor [Colletotrichum asianum]|uniref:Carboxylic ester hydrolase n=1 Tax=Colletotrichum asianum TaxID=702518 RepID=A0A8H3ZHB0_9PEZI|nr:feruloyl esterase b precursor [Colletotrichum asianum]